MNGELGDVFSAKKGFHQGDSSSPYLFILVADVLQRLCCMHFQDGSLLHPLGSDVLFPVLQYADDTLLIFQGVLQQAQVIKTILSAFLDFSGLQINFHKSTLVPVSVDVDTALDIARVLGCPVSSFPCTYLSLPLSLHKITHGMLLPIIHRVDKRLSGWLATFLSWGGRLTLLNSVLAGIPSYFMACFLWPKEPINKLEGLLHAFFWQGKRKISGGHCLVAWDKVILPRYAGVLGIRDLSAHNQAMLCKFVAKVLPFSDIPCY